jgi:hypothetical protein
MNADHLKFLRIGDSQDVVIQKLLDDNEKLTNANIGIENGKRDLQYQLNNQQTQNDAAMQQQYAKGYAQGAADTQRRYQGQ